MQYQIIESRCWKHSDGRTASIYGGVPYYTEEDGKNWQVVTVGYTVRNLKTGVVGIGKKPFKTLTEAQEFVNSCK